MLQTVRTGKHHSQETSSETHRNHPRPRSVPPTEHSDTSPRRPSGRPRDRDYSGLLLKIGVASGMYIWLMQFRILRCFSLRPRLTGWTFGVKHGLRIRTSNYILLQIDCLITFRSARSQARTNTGEWLEVYARAAANGSLNICPTRQPLLTHPERSQFQNSQTHSILCCIFQCAQALSRQHKAGTAKQVSQASPLMIEAVKQGTSCKIQGTRAMATQGHCFKLYTKSRGCLYKPIHASMCLRKGIHEQPL